MASPKTYKNVYIILLSVSLLLSMSLVYYYTYHVSSYSQSLPRWNELKKKFEAILPWTYSSGNGGNGSEDYGGRGAPPFKILFWTNWYGYRADRSGEFIKLGCKDEFIVTSDRSEVGDADVIIFQLFDIIRGTVKWPPSRNINVPWILASQEASIHRPLRHNRFDGVFNWTWSSQTNSLIHPNFTEMFQKFEEPDKKWVYGTKFSKEFLSNKTKTGSWVVSNCGSVKNKRNQLVSTLRNEYQIQIDIYGRCGKLVCKGDCFPSLGLSYKFYFAMENSLCEDYITEKIYHGLLYGMVPVVYALGNVGNYAPPNSFINVLDFPSLSELAQRLQYLDENPQEFFKYFEWRQSYNVSGAFAFHYQCHIWNKMKEYTLKLRGDDEGFKYRHVYKNFNEWYTSFHNKKLDMRCKACLDPRQIDIVNLTKNKRLMYEDPTRCEY